MNPGQLIDFENPTIIKLEPAWFRMAYYVYIVHIDYKGKEYLYAGMTGDRRYKTARSPFYRMSGHFSQIEKSTQNQVYKGLKTKIEGFTNDMLCEMQVTYYAWQTASFGDETDKSHHDKRSKAEKIEEGVIQLLREAWPDETVFNKTASSKRPIPEEAREIVNAFKGRIGSSK